jgi:membrane-associated phospholipid phosphatase
VDCTVSQFCASDRKASDQHGKHQIPNGVRQIFQLSEGFGHGFGVGAIILAVYLLDRPRRRAVPRLLTMAFGAGLAADIFKLLVLRTRPRDFDFAAGNVWDTFVRWLPLGGPSGTQSFPSAHTATAVGLALGLAWLYPRGRWLFAAMAVLVACQRIESTAHFPSDVLFGAALGFLVAAGCFSGPLGRAFERWERKPVG